MVLHVYDSGVNLLGAVEEIISLIWTRNYWYCGEFSLLAPMTGDNADLLRENRLIMAQGGSEAAQIQYVNYRKSREGFEEIEAHGKFLPIWIGRRVIAEPLIATSGYPEIIRRIVYENLISPADPARAVAGLYLADDPAVAREDVEYASEPYINALLAVEDAALAAKLGFKITTDPLSKTHAFRVYEGRDLSYGNTAGNAPCVFSREYDNVLEQEYTRSVENLRTTAYVPGDGARALVGGEETGLSRREVYVKGEDISRTYTNENDQTITLTDGQYMALLNRRGAAELSQYQEALSFSSRVNNHSNLKYARDYDLGDIVTCVSSRWGVSINARITSITESWQSGANDIEITFGENLPTLMGKVRNISRGA